MGCCIRATSLCLNLCLSLSFSAPPSASSGRRRRRCQKRRQKRQRSNILADAALTAVSFGASIGTKETVPKFVLVDGDVVVVEDVDGEWLHNRMLFESSNYVNILGIWLKMWKYIQIFEFETQEDLIFWNLIQTNMPTSNFISTLSILLEVISDYCLLVPCQ